MAIFFLLVVSVQSSHMINSANSILIPLCSQKILQMGLGKIWERASFPLSAERVLAKLPRSLNQQLLFGMMYVYLLDYLFTQR